MKNINAKRVAEKLGKAHSYIYKVKKGKHKCPVKLAGAIYQAARELAREMNLPPESIIGWRLQDLRPDVIEMVFKCLYPDDNSTLSDKKNGQQKSPNQLKRKV